MNNERAWIRYAGIAGIVFVVLSLVAAFLPGSPPKPDDPTATIRAYYADHRGAMLLGTYLTGIATIASLWFMAALYDVLRRAEGGMASMALSALIAGVVTNVVALLATMVTATLAFNAGQVRDDATVRLLFDMGNMAFALIFFPWALFTGAASVVMIRTGVFARWLGYLGLAAAALMLVSAAGLGLTSGALAAGGPLALVALVFGMLWGLGAAVLLYRMASVPEVALRTQPA